MLESIAEAVASTLAAESRQRFWLIILLSIATLVLTVTILRFGGAPVRIFGGHTPGPLWRRANAMRLAIKTFGRHNSEPEPLWRRATALLLPEADRCSEADDDAAAAYPEVVMSPKSRDPVPGARILNAAVTGSAPLFYPIFAVPLARVLALGRMRPHEELVASGEAREWDSAVDGPLLFISHQWTAFSAPDPTGTQFALLAGVLRNAIARTLHSQLAEGGNDGGGGGSSSTIFEPLYTAVADPRGAWVWLEYTPPPLP